jgi:integrase
MPVQKRHKTKYAGVYYIEGKAVGPHKIERIYYITYRKNGKLIEEKAGRQFQNDMTPARAAGVRAEKIDGRQLPNREKRKRDKILSAAEMNRWTISKLWVAYKKNKPNLKGLITDENRFKNYIESNFGHKEPKDIIPLDVDRLRLNLLKKKAPGTVKNVLELLRRIINFGSKKNLCEGLNFIIEMPTINNLKTEDLNASQLQKLIKAIEKDDHLIAGNIMLMALFTGLRRGELFKLKGEDIDFERGFINIVDPKGGPDQKVPLNDKAREILKNHIQAGDKYIFPGRGGCQRTDISKAVNAIKKAAGLPKDFRPLHGLRHVYASMLASSGQVELYTLQKLLTHKSPQMTQRYAHLRDGALKQASDLAGEIIKTSLSNK